MVATERSLDVYKMLMRAPDQSEWVAELDALLTPPEWHRQANCRGVDQTLFFPERGESNAPARAICSACQVRAECLDVALSADMPGIWASTTLADRRKMRR